jgi:Bifunctional DNA primase/polymerase, N-terminal/Primase C terminal 2 (PriCT-2)
MIEGLPKFRCKGDKTPLVHWKNEARIDIDDSEWALVGVPTGSVTGFDVLDVDVEGLPWFDAQHLPLTRMHQTRSGGIHLFFKHVDGLRGSVSRIAAGVDVRAEGNMVIWWARQGLPVCEAPIAEWPEWLLQLAMKPASRRTRAGLGAVHEGIDGSMLAKLNPIDYREHDDWFELMKACHAAGVDREAWIEWCVSDPVYADHGEEVGQRWDSLRIGDWGRRVDTRLAELNKGICPKRKAKLTLSHHDTQACQGPFTSDANQETDYRLNPQRTGNLEHRVTALLREVEKGEERRLFWASAVMREIIAEGKINPTIAVQLLEEAWPKAKEPNG